MKRTPLSFVSLALLVLAGWQTVTTLSRTPAFNGALQVESPDGRHYTGYAPTMYDRATYYQWMAKDWQGYGTFGAKDTTPGDPDVVSEGLRRLRDIATESLKHAPGDPSAWMQLAEAKAGLGDPGTALAALDRAYDLAPKSVIRAVGRIVFLTSFVEDPDARALALAELDLNRVDADLKLLAEDKFRSSFARGTRNHLVGLGFSLAPLPEA